MDGYTLMHEHTTIDLSGVKKNMDCRLDLMDETIKEYKQLYDYGVRRIVDVTADGMGRNPDYVTHVSEETGIYIVQATGYYKEPFLPEKVYNMTVQELADNMIKEITVGIDGKEGGPKAGIIGEIGTSENEMKDTERKVFDAAVIAARATGAPIYTHTTLSTYAYEQAMYFKETGLPMDRIVIGHIDLSGDLGYIRKVLSTGITVGFDTVSKDNYFPDSGRVEFLKALQDDGLLDQVVLSLDLTRKSHLSVNGGPGYTHMFTKFVPMLREAGVTEESIDKMLIHNPNRILGF